MEVEYASQIQPFAEHSAKKFTVFLDILWISEWKSGPTDSTISQIPLSSTPPNPGQNPTEIQGGQTQILVCQTQFIYFKNLTNGTRIWVWPPWISVGFCPGLGGVEERGICEIVESVGPDFHSEIHSISKNTVNFWAECSANGCIWLAYSTSTVF